jgi:hypothetical protein
VSVDPRFERFVLAELALQERRARRRDGSYGARVLAQRLHRGRDDLLAHLRRVVQAVPSRFGRVAWLHHAHEADVTRLALTLSKAPGSAGYLARVVARAAIEDRLDGARPVGETLTALCLLPDSRLAT